MSNYWLIIIWTGVVWFLSHAVNVERTELVCGQRVRRYSPMWAFLVFLPLILWCGSRGHVGDTGAYLRGFQDMPSQFDGISAYMQTIEKDKGFYFLSAVIKCIIGNREVWYLILIALLQSYFLIRVYRKYSTNYAVSFFLFIASTDYLSWMFNGMRQFVAATIAFGAFTYILKKKYVRAVLIVLIASLFHASALLIVPFIFIVQGKAWNKKTLLFIVSVLLAVTFIGQFTDILDNLLTDTQYTNVVSEWKSWNDDGTNPIRVLVYAVPTILSLFARKYIRQIDDPCINLCTNMSIVSTGFYIISIFTSGIFIGRIPIYFSLYNYILLPWELRNIFTRRTGEVMSIAMVVGYLAFYAYSISGLGLA